MRKVAALALVPASLVAVRSPVASADAAGKAAPRDAVIVAQVAPGAGHELEAMAAVGTSARARPAGPAGRFVLRVPAADAATALARLRAEPGVRSAELSTPVHTTAIPDDPCYTVGCVAGGSANPMVKQGYLATIGAPAAWDVSKGDGVRVAVLDTGVEPNHEDLTGKIWRQTDVICPAGQAVCEDGDPNDDNGHGTHVSGLVAATTNNGVGIASLGWNVMLDEYKVLDENGNGFTADVDTAIYDAVAAGDRVINMSLANYSCQEATEAGQPTDCGPDPDEQAAVEYAISRGVVVVAAAGNGVGITPADDGLTYPASYPGVLSAAATDDSGSVQSFSQWGAAANIAAPGLNVLSTWFDAPDSYALDTGTSMAAPLVAAAAALLISHDPSLSGQQVTELLEASAAPDRGGRPINGGLLDVPAGLAAESRPAPRSFLGYDLVSAQGRVFSYGSVGYFGDLGGRPLARPIVGTAVQPNGLGYWLVASDGGVFSFGAAGFHGSTGAIRLARPIVGMASTKDGRGYWLVASDGGIFAFGDAGFYGSTGAIRLARPIVGMAATPDGRGYWLVASDGGLFAFGDAGFHGSNGNIALQKPVVGMTATASGKGYWLVASDGGIFTFGDARFRGSAGRVHLVRPIVGMVGTPDGNGYWLVASDGGVFSYGDARYYGGGGSPGDSVVAAAS
jgi:subtilisin family serine protease